MEPGGLQPLEQPVGASLRSSRVTINLTPAVHAELRRWAAEEGRSLSNLCQKLIEASIELRNS
jgi:hypothetical protein